MSDLIKQQAVIDKLDEIQKDIIASSECYSCTVELVEAIDYIQQEIYELPTVEAKPVVHCKDCVHWGTGVAGETEHVKCCEYGKYMVGENGYCCYADMRGGKNE